jgi:5-oxopent-3-ene-1,2,5-tricarboxylate decarboxylase/2-hydroxyhepta-2,4-diene-1,7-dioate isomerase
MHPEVELAVVIGRPMKKVRAASAMDYVLGFTIVNDLVVRDFVHGTYRPPIRAKGHDTFGPMGPFLVTADEVPDPHNLALATYVNDKLVQQGRTSQMLLTIPEILEFVSSFMTLQPYDVILTGTPPGISPVKPKDVMKVVVEGLGELENPVEEEP